MVKHQQFAVLEVKLVNQSDWSCVFKAAQHFQILFRYKNQKIAFWCDCAQQSTNYCKIQLISINFNSTKETNCFDFILPKLEQPPEKCIPEGCVLTATVATTRCQFPGGGGSASTGDLWGGGVSLPLEGGLPSSENITFPCGRYKTISANEYIFILLFWNDAVILEQLSNACLVHLCFLAQQISTQKTTLT